MSSSVGRLAFIVVGTVIGSFLGNPALGFALGSAIGGLVFAPEGQKVEGPRIGDTEVQSSSLGVTIPLQFGTTRGSGMVLWSGGLREDKDKEKQGKGGGGGSVTTYTYFASFLLSFGFGPAIALRRMWADGKLIYDSTGTGDVQNNKYKFRFYKGDGVSAPDSLVSESINRRLAGLPDVNEGNGEQATFTTIQDLIDEGIAAGDAGDERGYLIADALTARASGPTAIFTENPQYYWYTGQALDDQFVSETIVPEYRFTPSYNDLCHVVFDDIALEDFGNRIPNITAEIVFGTTDQIISLTGTVAESVIPETSPVVTAPTSLHGFHVQTRKLLLLSGTTLRRFDYTQRAETGFVVDPTIVKVIGADSAGNMIVNTTEPKVARTHPLTFVPDGTVGAVQGIYTAPIYGAALYDGITSNVRLFAVVNTDNNLGVLRVDDVVDEVWGTAVADSGGVLDDVTTIGEGPMTSGGTSSEFGTDTGSWARVYMLGVDVGGGTWTLYAITASYSLTGGSLVHFVHKNIIVSGPTGGMTVRNIIYDTVTNRTLLFFDNFGAGHVKKYTDDGQLSYAVDTTYMPPGPESGFQNSTTSNGRVSWATGNNITEFNILNGVETVTGAALTFSASAVAQIYISINDTILTWNGDVPTFIALNRSTDETTAGSTKLSSILASLCSRAGMAADEFDVAAVPDTDLVFGFTIARPSSARQAMDKLVLPYLIDGIETDWTIKFKERSVTPIRTLTEQELGPVKGPTGDVNWLETRKPDHELAQEVNITFIDRNRDYQTGASRAGRIAQPVNTMFSVTKQNIELPMVMGEPDAQAAAQRILYLGWLSRDRSKTKLSWGHADLDPTDLITVQFDESRTTIERIGTATMGADFSVEMIVSRAGDPVHTFQSSLPITTSSVPTNRIVTPVFTQLFTIDMPLLYDFHDVNRTASRLFIAAGTDSDQWVAAQLFQSDDGANYLSAATLANEITWGVVSGTLPAPRSLWTTDKDNSLTIVLGLDVGDIVSVTREQIINSSANRAIIFNPSTGISEIIQFQDVVANVNGSYTLTNLCRGLRGTDYAVSDHSSGAFFILIKDAAIETPLHELGALGSTRFFRAVSSGATLGGAPTQSLVLEGRSLMPWAVNNYKRADDGSDLTVTWTRRARVGGAWNMAGAGVEPVPLAEDLEQYEVYLLPTGAGSHAAFDPADATTYELLDILTTPTRVYTAAELATATIALTDDVNMVVYQISGQVGRGFKSEAVLIP